MKATHGVVLALLGGTLCAVGACGSAVGPGIDRTIEEAIDKTYGFLEIPTGHFRANAQLLSVLRSAESAGLVTVQEVQEAYWDSFLTQTQGMGKPVVVRATQKLLGVAVAPPSEPATPSAASLVGGMTVTTDEARRWYEQNLALYSKPERIRASHILFKTEGANAAVARKRAEEVLAKVKAGGDFSALAKQYSEDSSKAAGGDLDYFGRGAMVKPFEDAAWALQVGQTSGLVQSEFGFHIIKLTDRQPSSTPTFEQLRPSLEAAIKTAKATAEAERLAIEAAKRAGPVTLRVAVQQAKMGRVVSDEEYRGSLATPGERHRLQLGIYRRVPTAAAVTVGGGLAGQVEQDFRYRCVLRYSEFKKEWNIVAIDSGSLDPERWFTENVR